MAEWMCYCRIILQNPENFLWSGSKWSQILKIYLRLKNETSYLPFDKFQVEV